MTKQKRCIWFGDAGHQCKRVGKYHVEVPWQMEVIALGRRDGSFTKPLYCKKCLIEMLDENLDSTGWQKLKKVKLSYR